MPRTAGSRCRRRPACRDGNLALARAERASAVPGLGRGRRGGAQVAGACGPGRGAARGAEETGPPPPASSAPALRPRRRPGSSGAIGPHAAPPGAVINHHAAVSGPHPRRRPPAGPGHPPPAEGGRTEGLWKMRELGGARGTRLPLGKGRCGGGFCAGAGSWGAESWGRGTPGAERTVSPGPARAPARLRLPLPSAPTSPPPRRRCWAAAPNSGQIELLRTRQPRPSSAASAGRGTSLRVPRRKGRLLGRPKCAARGGENKHLRVGCAPCPAPAQEAAAEE